MRNFFRSVGLLLSVALFVCSCNNEKTPQSQSENLNVVRISLDGTEVYGDAGAYFALVPGSYDVKVKDGKIRLKLKLRVRKNVSEDVQLKRAPMLAFLDEDGAQIDLSAYGVLSNEDKFLSFLRSEAGTESDMLFVNDHLDHEECQYLLSNVRGVSVDGLVFKNPLGDFFEETVRQAEEVDEEDLERAVEVSKSALEVSKSAIDMLNQLDGMMK